MTGKNVVILYGGHPDEMEISKQSGFNVLQACIELKLDPIFININKVELQPMLESIFDPVILNMVHGKWGEDGAAQVMFEEMGIPYFGCSVYASELIFDKAKFREHMQELVRMPKGGYFSKEEYQETWKTFPHVIKPHDSGSSVGVEYIEKLEDVDLSKWMGKKIVEEYIEGIEGTTVVYNGKCIGGVIIKYDGKLFDYETKYTPGLSTVEYWDSLDQNVRDELSKFSEEIFDEANCRGFIRVDFKVSSEGVPYILEANTLPGMTKKSLVPYVFAKNGTEFNDLVQLMIKDAESGHAHASEQSHSEDDMQAS